MDRAIEVALQDEVAGASGEPGSDRDVERLSVRERQIARLITQGRSNREIAETLVLSIKTVESHVKNVSKKLRVGKRAEIAAWVARQGLS
jgi:non-specific serine/threonine protein kinase